MTKLISRLATIAWLPLIYLSAYLAKSDVWYDKATVLVSIVLIVFSLISMTIAFIAEDSVFYKAWRAK
jgi:hypothetical protein